MDMSWTRSPRNTEEYIQGVHRFVDHLSMTESLRGKIRCPCRKCKYVKFLLPNDVKADLMYKGIEECHMPNEHGPPPQQHVENDFQEKSRRNASNRSHQGIVHILGRTSFAQKKVDMRHKLNRDPHRFKVYEEGYKRKDGTYANDATKEATERLVRMAAESPENEDQAFREVLGPERKGRKRGIGRGGTIRENDPSLIAKVEELTQQLAEKEIREVEMRKEQAEMRKELAEVKAEFNALRQSQQSGASLSQPPHQMHGPYELIHAPYEQTHPPYQQMHAPYHRRVYGPYSQTTTPYNHDESVLYPHFAPYQHQNQVPNNQVTGFQQHLQGYTELLRSGEYRAHLDEVEVEDT